jgi:hypothetical protein
MPRLWIITGNEGVGKTKSALIQTHGKKFVWTQMSSFKQTVLQNLELRSAEFLILDECHTEEHVRTIYEIWNSGKIIIHEGAKAILAMTTPELIAIFQTGNLSDEWMEKFRVRGAYITNISRRKEVSHE